MNTKYHVPGSAHDVIRSPRETQCGGGVYDHIVVINPASYSVHALYVSRRIGAAHADSVSSVTRCPDFSRHF